MTMPLTLRCVKGLRVCFVRGGGEAEEKRPARPRPGSAERHTCRLLARVPMRRISRREGGSRLERGGAPAQWARGVARCGSPETPVPAPRPPL